MLNLVEALTLTPGTMISLVGGGGKTTAMYRLGQELAAQGQRVIITTSTKLWPPESEQCPRIILNEDCQVLVNITRGFLGEEKLVCLGTDINVEGKLTGLSRACLNKLRQQKLADYIICEADGSRGKPLKAPADHEPVIAETSDIVIAVLGWQGLHKTLNEQNVQRSALFSRLTGCPMQSTLTSRGVAEICKHPQGLFKGSPPTAQKFILVNQIDQPGELPEARELAYRLCQDGVEKVLLCSLQSQQGVWEVVR